MAKRKSNPRGYSLRKVETREVRQRFLIVCEGKETEPNYFKSFRVPKNVVAIDVRGLGANPSKLVQKAKKLSEEEDYDRIWCVFDRNSWSLEDFNNAIADAKKNEFGVAYSNEAFELWYILHFEYLDTAIPRSDYINKLTSYIGKPYKKNSRTTYEELLEKQPVAIRNAEKLLETYGDLPDPANNNPSTTVHLLVQELNRFVP